MTDTPVNHSESAPRPNPNPCCVAMATFAPRTEFTERIIDGTRHALAVLDGDDYSTEGNVAYGRAIAYLRENAETIARTLIVEADRG